MPTLTHTHMQTSSLVTSEWYMRNDHFPGWARPYEFAAELLSGVGKRDEEARDMARVALRLPWWTLAHGYEASAKTGCVKAELGRWTWRVKHPVLCGGC